MDIQKSDVHTSGVLTENNDCTDDELVTNAGLSGTSSTNNKPATNNPAQHASNSTNAKPLPNIQPKVVPSHGVSFQRQIIPKNEVVAAQPVQAAAAPNSQPSNIIIPQGIQHVLINGQLYPIIQTANGTHLLIQQPVGQIQQQNGGKQVFTAQPIQLANAQGVLPNQPASNGTQPAEPTAKEQLPSAQVPVNQNNQSLQKTSPSKTAKNQLPVGTQPSQQPVPARGGIQTAPVTVSPQTQQILTKIQNQIEALKPKAGSDPVAKNNLQQLQQIQQQILTELRNQMQKAMANAASANEQSQPVPQGAPPAVIHQQSTSVVTTPQLIVQPVKDGESPMTNSNLISLVTAFTNVKVGAQVYNIQLTEEQKKSMITKMNKMAAAEQHEFVYQQQIQILQQALRGSAMSTAPPPQNQQLPQQPPPQQQQQNNTDTLHQQSSPKPGNKFRARRRAAQKAKPANDSPVPSPRGDTDDSSHSSNKGRTTPVRRSKYTSLSSKRIGEKMLAQIQKDQEVLLKAGSHKKLFHNKSQLSERLLRYHIYYTDDKLLSARRLQEAELFDSIANKMVLRKEQLLDRFRTRLWRESTEPAPTEEDRLVVELLLEDERQAMEDDKLLEQTDIDRFKLLFKEPEKVPTPLPSSPPKSPNSCKSTAALSRSPSSPAPLVSSPEKEPEEQEVQTNDHVSNVSDKAANKNNRKPKVLSKTAKPARSRLKKTTRTSAKSSKLKQSESKKSDKTPSAIKPTATSENKAHKLRNVLSEYVAIDPVDLESPPLVQPMEDDTQVHSPIQAAVPSSSDEDDIIDIGNPPTPPQASPPHHANYSTSPHHNDYSTLPHHPDFSASILSPTENSGGYSSSPKKFFSICSETVVAQSQQVDNSYDNLQEHESSNDLDDSYHSSSFNCYSNADDITNIAHHSAYPPGDSDNYPMETESMSDNEHYSVNVDLDTDVERGVNEDNDSQSADYNSSNENNDYDDGDTSINDGGELEDIPQEPRAIAPLRINKKRLEDCRWSDGSYQDEICPPIKLKINEPVPPPIKLRIKRDINDKWETASAISMDDGAMATSDEDEDEDISDQEAQYGGVTVNWDNETDRSDNSEEDEDDNMYGEEDNENYQSGYHQNNFEDEESVPFTSYASYSEESD